MNKDKSFVHKPETLERKICLLERRLDVNIIEY